MPDGEGSSALHSAAVLASDSGWTEREIVSGLKKQLPLYAVPGDIRILDSLPRTPTGKVDRTALRALIDSQEE
jgi:acyl-CoA synthetase (AMP-forming)/AMP-acid ligase II